MMRKGPPGGGFRPPLVTESVSGQVSWFSTAKGFGFIKPTDGSGDVFVHVSVLQRAGLESLKDGTTVTAEVVPGKKGRQVQRLLEVDESTASETQSGGPGGPGGDRPPRPPREGGFGGGGFGGGGFRDRGGDRGGFGGGGGGFRDRGGDRGGFGGGGGGFGGGGFGGGMDAGGPSVDGEGTIKWFNATKGFGFITPEGGGKDVFLHASVLRRAGLADVAPGQKVQYSAIERDKGPEARSIVVLDGGGI